MYIKKQRGFTLVELVITITILVILSTIAFVSFQSYVRDSRDASRLESQQQIFKGASLYYSQKGDYPLPEKAVTISFSGNNLMYQGDFTQNIADTLGVNGKITDPLDNSFYTYVVDYEKNIANISVGLEDDSKISSLEPNKVYAQTVVKKYFSVGKPLPVFFDSSNIPVQNLSLTGIDLSTNPNYSMLFKNKTLMGSGVSYLNYYSSTIDSVATFDTSLVGYWDLETLQAPGVFKDLSNNDNNGDILPGISIAKSSECLKGKCLYSDGYGAVATKNPFNPPTQNFTIRFALKFDKTVYNDGFFNCGYYISSLGYYVDGVNGNFSIRSKVGSGIAPHIEVPVLNGKTLISNYYENTAYDDKKWHVVHFVKKGDTQSMYMDGVNLGDYDVPGVNIGGSAANNALGIASKTYGCTGTFYMDEVRSYYRSFSPDEIKNDFEFIK